MDIEITHDPNVGPTPQMEIAMRLYQDERRDRRRAEFLLGRVGLERDEARKIAENLRDSLEAGTGYREDLPWEDEKEVREPNAHLPPLPSVEQADGESKRSGDYHQHLKKRKARLERRRAKQDPEAPPGYGRYRGWET